MAITESCLTYSKLPIFTFLENYLSTKNFIIWIQLIARVLLELVLEFSTRFREQGDLLT